MSETKARIGCNSQSQVRARIYQPVAMLVHAIASMPAKNAGALMAVSGIKDAVPLIHGPPGCANLRQMNSFDISNPVRLAPCTNLSEIDVVLGGETKLYRSIIDLYHRLHPALIVVIPTCPSDMMGDDFGGIVEKAKKEVGCEVIYSTGESIPGRPIGYHDVMCSVVEQLLLPKAPFPKTKKSVNLLNFPMDVNKNQFMDLIPILNEMGVKVNKIGFYNTHLTDLYELPKAELNIVDFPSPWIEKMKDHLGVDYLAASSFGSDPDSGNPFGIEGAARILLEVAERLGIKESAERVIEKKKEEAMENCGDLRKKLRGIRIAVLDGFSFGPAITLVSEFRMKLEAISYRSFFMKSHGMSDNAYNQLIEMDIEATRRYGCEPEVLRDPTPEQELEVFKDRGVQLVVCNGGIARYNEAGIRGFNGVKFFMQSMSIGFDSTRILAESVIEALNTPIKKYPLVNMIGKDAQEPNLIPQWKKLGVIWRKIAEGGDGGCLYG
ncbi:MAG: nitrogenase component 1 [Methanophagales archaeon]|nr:nitrogenase component 1 [Methanophagales archaeon]